jgi:LPS-assembly lipoprotein
VAARRIGAALLAAAALVVAGCGWQLRGDYDMPAAITPIGVENSGIGTELRRNLQRMDALGGDPASRIEILEENEDRRVVSVDQDGKVNEYEINYRVRWQLVGDSNSDMGQRILIPPQTLQSARTYDFNAASVLSKSEEREARVEEMRSDMVQQILFQLQGWRPQAAGDGTGAGAENAAE